MQGRPKIKVVKLLRIRLNTRKKFATPQLIIPLTLRLNFRSPNIISFFFNFRKHLHLPYNSTPKQLRTKYVDLTPPQH